MIANLTSDIWRGFHRARLEGELAKSRRIMCEVKSSGSAKNTCAGRLLLKFMASDEKFIFQRLLIEEIF